MASGINSTFRQVGIATGIAAWGAVFQHAVVANYPERGWTSYAPLQTTNTAGTEGLADAIAFGAIRTDAVRTAFVEGLNDILVYGALVAFAGALLSLPLVRARDFVAHGPGAAG